MLMNPPNQLFWQHLQPFFHEYQNTSNKRLLPYFGIDENVSLKLQDTPNPSNLAVSKNWQEDFWEGVSLKKSLSLGDTFICDTYNKTQCPLSGSWLSGCLSKNVEILASNDTCDCAILLNRGHAKNGNLVSIYASQMLEYSSNEQCQRLFYNIICWLARRRFKWSPTEHWRFSPSFRAQVKVILLMSQRSDNGKPYHPECLFYRIPSDVLHIIFQFLVNY